MAELSDIERILGEAEQATAAGDHSGAERSLRRGLRLQEAALGLVHPDVANTLNDLGVVCDRLGRPDEAEFLYRRALGIARRTLEPEHPYIATSLQNLSNLYEAQGRPEKLVKAREGGTSGSGLPESDSDDGFEDGDPAEATAQRPVSATQVPVSPSHVESLQQRPSPALYGWLANPIVLVGLGAALLAGGWLLLGGSVDPDDPIQRTQDAGSTVTQSQTSEADEGPVGTGPTTPAASVETPAQTPTASTTDSAADSMSAAETVQQAAASAAETPPIVAPSSDERPAVSQNVPTPAQTAEPDSGDLPAVTTSSVVAAAEICSQLDTRAPDGAPLAEWRCEPVSEAQATPAQLFFYTRIRSPTAATVAHRWLRNGVLQQRIELDIGANNGAGYRTYSSHTVSTQQRGTRRVELQSSDQELLYAEEFVVP